MNSRPFVRAVLTGAGVMLVLLVAIFFLRQPAPEPKAPPDFDPAQFVGPRPQLDAPYVATEYEVVDAMLAMADIRPDDVVVDLGSGDGRILIAAARSHGARGIGVDIDPARIREANANAQAAGVTNRVAFRREDLFRTPIRDADVVTLYLLQEINLRLRPRLLAEMRPGARVVSHAFDMGDWRADQRQQVGTAAIYMWIVPARIGGRWTLRENGRSLTLQIDQRFQEFGGTVTLGNGTATIDQGRIAGDRIRFTADLGEGRRTFEGRVTGDRIESAGTGDAWQASRTG